MISAELLGIATGLALALGIFAFKTAVGEYYFFSVSRSRGRSVLFLAVTWGLYLLLFGAAFLVLARFDLFRFAGNSMKFLKAGAAIHLALCAGLLVWGVRLLCRRDAEELSGVDARGWLLLAIPCPVCAAAVFLVCALARMLLPEYTKMLYWLVPAFFLFANAVFLLGLWGAGKAFALRPLQLTGRMMIFIALYFFLILLIAPQFQDADKLYTAALATGNPHGISASAIGICLLLGAAAAAGFLLETLKRKER